MHIYQLIFNKSAKNTKWGKSILFNKHHCENWISTCKGMELDPYLISYVKYQLNLNIRPEAVIFLEKDIKG